MIQFDVFVGRKWVAQPPTTKKMSCFCNGTLKILPLKTTSKKEAYAVPPQHKEEHDPFWPPSVFAGVFLIPKLSNRTPTIDGWWIVWVIERITPCKK